MPPELRPDALVGTVLDGAYRLTRPIGQGGMGTVYEAVQLRLDKRVAVKLLARHLTADRKALARFHREAEITSHLGHPHLVSVVDYGQTESGEPYLVMEYLEGEDLDHRLRRVGCLPVEAVVHVIRQAASALSAAHAQGIVHRDLKPGNIFLLQIPGEPDFVKVVDFGISKMMAAHTRLTNAAMAVGTPNYMSPEQATGMTDAIDHHIDQWALACIAWEMLLGTPPFVAADTTALLHQIIKIEPPALAPRVPGLPSAVELELRRALSKRPGDRFPSIRDFSHAFEAAAFGRPADATPPPMTMSPPTYSNVWTRWRPWHRIGPRHVIVAAAFVLLFAGAFLLFRSGSPSAPRNVHDANTSPPIGLHRLPPTVPLETTEVNPAGTEPEAPRSKPAKAPASAGTAGPSRGKRPARRSKRHGVKRRLIQQL
jgi:serine/threonine protein kinase